MPIKIAMSLAEFHEFLQKSFPGDRLFGVGAGLHCPISTPLKSLLRISNNFPHGSIFPTTFIKVHQGESFFLNRDFMANPDRQENKIKLRVMSMGTVKPLHPKALMHSFFIAMSIMQKKAGSCLGSIAMRQVPLPRHWQKKRSGRFFMMQVPLKSCNPSRNIRRSLATKLGAKFIPTRFLKKVRQHLKQPR